MTSSRASFSGAEAGALAQSCLLQASPTRALPARKASTQVVPGAGLLGGESGKAFDEADRLVEALVALFAADPLGHAALAVAAEGHGVKHAGAAAGRAGPGGQGDGCNDRSDEGAG